MIECPDVITAQPPLFNGAVAAAGDRDSKPESGDLGGEVTAVSRVRYPYVQMYLYTT